MRRPLSNGIFLDGLQAIEWTVDERGLAGLSDLDGIAWSIPIDQFFEAWVETVIRKVAQRVGGRLKTGRLRETVSPLAWEPPYAGSQRSPSCAAASCFDSPANREGAFEALYVILVNGLRLCASVTCVMPVAFSADRWVSG